jgi:uncharacterized protein with FMN-binding domain
MKKAIVSLIIIGAFVIYSIIHDHSGLAADVPNISGGPRSSTSSATAPAPTTVPGTTVTPGGTTAPGSLYKDGTYVGSVADAQWGYVQIQTVIQSGKISSVKFLQYPNDRDRSIYINSIADPMLINEAIQAQTPMSIS